MMGGRAFAEWRSSQIPASMRDNVHALGRRLRPREDMVMRLSSSLIAPSAVAILSTILLCGPAASQTATGSNAPLPDITVEAPKHVARPHRSQQVTHTVAPRRASRVAQGPSSSGQASSSTGHTPSAARGPVMQRIAKLEARASSCNGGCETSFKTGKEPWVGCSESTGGYVTAMFSTTCRDTLSYKSYADCLETKMFLGWDQRRARWHCSGLDAGARFQVADIKRSRDSR
jgi:hypothetical protein